MITRRAVLAGSLVALQSCVRRKARGFSGYAFVANEEGGAVAAVDLEVFAVARHIRVDGAPTAVIAHPRLSRVYALTPDNGLVHEIRSDTLTFSRNIRAGAPAVAMRLSPDGETMYVLCKQPNRLVGLALRPLRVAWTSSLAAEPADVDVSPDGSALAISHGNARAITFIDPRGRGVLAEVDTPGEMGLLRFQSDSTQLMAANLSDRMLSVYQTASRRLIAHLPLAVRPDHMCFNADGGQLFISGEGMDAVVVVYPYYTPQIGETVLAGNNPAAMAASQTYLFVANPKAGDVSILDIETRRVVAVAPVGTEPAYIAITPDDQYALVLNRVSGDMAVIRIPNVTRAVNAQRRWKKAPLFMMIPVGSRPVSAAVMAI